ncbi:DNA-directed RNA polymerase specialized sigma24 family protein [Streptomyces sp. 2333.5]|nr:DNA-directed RNA polymerase specialized sigma24 family protein [Streptomyces sp. 2333.5]SEE62678.1 DNA-directed RNA polymerase specialized sigma subunit, sigma24 family [Streptomyces sp. 2112.2]SOE11706.1 DNA-directed RNA polymerase specialized sigma subunit, sigma24 family [Streptomyces sp. 2323.1]
MPDVSRYICFCGFSTLLCMTQPCMTQREQAATAFDALHTRHAAALTQQAFLLTGRPRLAQRAVERGFRLAWQRWPQVAVDPDPAGWVRAATYEYALAPWHRLCPGLRTARMPDRLAAPAEPSDQALLVTLLSLPAPYRRTLVLHDGVGLGLGETAAEIEASTPAAAGRLAHAREQIAERLPELGLGGRPPARQGEILRARLARLAAAEQMPPPSAEFVRSGSERSAERTTRAVFGLIGLFALVTLLTVIVTPDHHTPPGQSMSRVPQAPVAPERHRHRDESAHKARGAHRAGSAHKARGAHRHGNEAVRKRLRQARLRPESR